MTAWYDTKELVSSPLSTKASPQARDKETDQKLQVLQIIQELSTVGGAERVACELAQAFGRAGVDNKVIASTVGSTAGTNIKVHRVVPWLSKIPTRGPLRYIGRALVVPFFSFAATRAARRYSRAVVLSHGDSWAGDVLVVHAVNSENLAQKRSAGDWRWLLNPLHLWVKVRDRWMIGGLKYRMFVAVSNRVATELQEHYGVPPSRIRVIPNGIDTARFCPDSVAGRAIRKEFGIPESAKLLLFVGHEFHRKGLAYVIGALERLGSDVWLLVVGSENPNRYRKMAVRSRDRLVFAGSRIDTPAFYAAADALILPTAYETFSLVCMEAMACAVPVFATAAGGIEDYLEDGVNGYRIARDANDIASKVAIVLADEELLSRLQGLARGTALRYEWDQIASRYIELLASIAVS